MKNFDECKMNARLFEERRLHVPNELIDLFIKCGKYISYKYIDKGHMVDKDIRLLILSSFIQGIKIL
jgi:hypothetical protein